MKKEACAQAPASLPAAAMTPAAPAADALAGLVASSRLASHEGQSGGAGAGAWGRTVEGRESFVEGGVVAATAVGIAGADLKTPDGYGSAGPS